VRDCLYTACKGSMLEIAKNFEQMATGFSPIVLIAPGLVCVVVGLFIWLGGLGFRRPLAAVVGAVSGGICGFFITDRNIMFVCGCRRG